MVGGLEIEVEELVEHDDVDVEVVAVVLELTDDDVDVDVVAVVPELTDDDVDVDVVVVVLELTDDDELSEVAQGMYSVS